MRGGAFSKGRKGRKLRALRPGRKSVQNMNPVRICSAPTIFNFSFLIFNYRNGSLSRLPFRFYASPILGPASDGCWGEGISILPTLLS